MSPNIVGEEEANNTRKVTCLRSLGTRPVGVDRPLVHVDPTTGKANGPLRKKLRTYLGIVAHDKVDVTYENWKKSPCYPEGFDMGGYSVDKDNVDDTVCEKCGNSKEKWAQFCQSHRDPSWEDVRKKAQAIQKQNTALHVLSRGGYEYLENKLMEEKKKKQLEEAAQSRSTDTVIYPPSPIRRHVKWKMAHTKKTGQMTSEATKEIADKIDSLEEQTSQGSFVAHGHQDLLTAIIGRLEHLGRIQSQGLALPPEPEFGPSATRVSTKKSCVDPSGNDPDTSDSDKCGLYVEENPPCLVALGRLYEGSTIIHNIPLLHDQVKVGVEEVRDADAPILVMWDVTMIGVFNDNFPLYIKHEDLSEIAHSGQCLSIAVVQLWIFAHWQMVVILPKENVVICVLKGLDDIPQSKSKTAARWIVVKVM
ncbi:hypothetical protein GmHk_20G057436 [Glycine max]|nr:hypothetical protein GmHk_20G057436 [Glycine max]